MGWNPFKKVANWVGDRVGNLDKGIRVASSLKGTGHFIGDVASNPIVQAGVGLATGGLAAPVLLGAAGGALKKGGGLRDAIGGGAKGALSYGAGKLVSKIPGVGAVADKLMPGGGGASLEELSSAAEMAGLESAGVGAGTSAASKAGSILGKAGGLVKEGDRYRKILDGAKTATDAYRAFDDRRKRDRLMRRWEDEENRNKPLREKARSLLLDDSRPDVSDVFRDERAPQNRYRRVRIGGDV